MNKNKGTSIMRAVFYCSVLPVGFLLMIIYGIVEKKPEWVSGVVVPLILSMYGGGHVFIILKKGGAFGTVRTKPTGGPISRNGTGR
jgi:hypothetical protein